MSDITWANVTVKLSDLLPWTGNPKTSTGKNAKQLQTSHDELGQFQTVAIEPTDKAGVYQVADGHQRLSAWLAKYGKAAEIDARLASRPLTETERRKIAIYSRQIGAWDWDVLSGWEPEELTGWGFDVDLLQDWRRDVAALGNFLESEEEQGQGDAEPQTNRAEELREKWGVLPGQMWRLPSRTPGQEHRLICGDCTDKSVVERVMGGEKARVIATSPPYSDQRDYELGTFDWHALMCGMVDATIPRWGNPCDVLVNLGLSYKDGRFNGYWDSWLEYCASIGHALYGWYVWDKGSGFPGEWNGRLAPAHEFVFHFSIGRVSATKWIETTGESAKRGVSGKRFRRKDGSLRELTSPGKIGQAHKVPDSVIRVGREMARGIHTQAHPAVFSIGFAEFLIKTWSSENDIALEPFSGSGTTLIAAENLSRQCRAVEISPAYVAVALQRYADAFGIRAELVE